MLQRGVNLSFLLIPQHNCLMRMLSRGRLRAAFFLIGPRRRGGEGLCMGVVISA